MAPQIRMSKLREYGDYTASERSRRQRLPAQLDAARIKLEHLIRQAEREGMSHIITKEDKSYMRMREKLND